MKKKIKIAIVAVVLIAIMISGGIGLACYLMQMSENEIEDGVPGEDEDEEIIDEEPDEEPEEILPERKILFISQGKTSTGETFCNISIINADGTDKIEIDTGIFSHSIFFPHLSPDGEKIAYTISSTLYVINTDGTGKTVLDEGCSVAEWSPDGTKLLCRWNMSIHVINVDGTGKIQLLDNPFTAFWSPDGTKILCLGWDGSLYVINVDGTGKIQLDSCGGHLPSWSPNGEKIVYGDDSGYLCIINVDGTGKTKIDDEKIGGSRIRWSPNGEKIAYVIEQNSTLCFINPDGTGKTKVDSEVDKWDSCLIWSPDGTKILYYSNFTAGNIYYIINTDGTGKIELGRVYVEVESPSWSPDGQWLVYAVGPSYEDSYIYTIRSDATAKTELTQGYYAEWLL
ncbi:MAG: PD40 domain-containing protein [Candidatus Nealsonbacteria bacterium]|nr:MAG: PD40 domain-containing protein [Candidatus Nealsonbacteria bacterium]